MNHEKLHYSLEVPNSTTTFGPNLGGIIEDNKDKKRKKYSK